MGSNGIPWKRVIKWGALGTGFLFVALNIDWIMGSIIDMGLHPLISLLSGLLFLFFVVLGIVKWKVLERFVHG